MKFKLMLIDDTIHQREATYRKVFPATDFDLVIVNNASEFEEVFSKTPVDGYIVDVVLDTGSWQHIGNAGSLLSKFKSPPRRAPVFLVSMNWGQKETIDALNVIKQIRDLDVLRYLTWQEFDRSISAGHEPDLHALRQKILDDLLIWHEKSTFRPKDDEDIRILVLADLQYKDPHTSTYASFSEQWIARTLRRYEKLPNFVVLAGDIAYSGDTSEYEQAKQRLEDGLLKELWSVSTLDNMRERVLPVPGNHDVNLRFLACRQFGWKRDEKTWERISNADVSTKDESFALEPFRQFSVELTGSRKWEARLASSYVDRRFEACGLRFFLLNTTLGSSISSPKNVEFPVAELQSINTCLGSGDRPEEFFNIVVSHHGVQMGGATTEQVSNWDTVGKQFFSMHHVGMWIFGHYHKEKVGTDDVGTGTVNLVQAPTLRIVPGENSVRGFSLIELNRNAGKVIGGRVHFYHLSEEGAPDGNPICKELSFPKHQEKSKTS